MKKTTKTSKLVLDRQTVRQLTSVELDQPAGGMHVDTFKCGGGTGSCPAACNQTTCCIGP